MTRPRHLVLGELEADDVADNLHLAMLRGLNAAHVTDALDRCTVLTALVARIDVMREREALQAIDDGASYAALGRAMGTSRQAAREWARHRRPSTSDDPEAA
jgi:hypothetical protein